MFERRKLPLSALRAFESAGVHLHLGRAGQALGVTHGAISHQVRSLETLLGVDLFIRDRNRLRLTAAGQRLLNAVRQGFDQILDGMLHLDPDSLSGSLVIGCTQSTAANWAIAHIMEFQAVYPDIELEIREIAPGQLDIPREIDIALCYGEPRAQDRRLELLAAPSVFPVCSPGLMFGVGRVTEPEHLLAFRLLDDAHNSWDRWFESMGQAGAVIDKRTRFFNTTLALNAARQGHGAALGNPLEIREDIKDGRLVQLIDASVPESNNYYLLAPPAASESLKARLFEDWIRQRLA